MTDLEQCPIDTSLCSEPVRRHVQANTPPALRLMAAKGLAPIAPRDLVTAQFILTFDKDLKVASVAEASLNNLDPRIANAVLNDVSIPSPVLGHLSQIFATRDDYVEPLLLNPSTPTSVFEDVATLCTEAMTELIANNQARLLERPEIVRGLIKNPNTLKSTSDRCVDFLVRSGIVVEGLLEFESALLRLDANDRIKAADLTVIPPELLDEKLLSEKEDVSLEQRTLIDDDSNQSSERDLDKLPLDERLRRLPLPALVAYATKGNKQVRKMLMRHTSRIVALAAVTSPMIQEPEVIEATQSKVTHQDVIVHIAKDKKNNWAKNYQVKVGLVNNPKTPLADAMRLVSTLNAKDIKALARSKNVPAGVRTIASKLSSQRAKRG